MSERSAARSSYDEIAPTYAANLHAELDGKPLDRALLDAFAEACADGVIADVGAGPAHVGGYLASRGGTVICTDLSPQMCRQATLPAFAADMCALPLRSASLAGIVCFYAVIHLDESSRAQAYAEFARSLRAGGHALISFHCSDTETAAGESRDAAEMMGHAVELTFRFLESEHEIALLAAAGLTLIARLDRAPYPEAEHPSRRSYLLVQRPA